MVLLFVCVCTNWFLNQIFTSLSMDGGYWDYDASGNNAATATTAIDTKRDFTGTMDT